MPTNRYFENFPLISYSNTEVVDITKRVAVMETVMKTPYAFLPYDLSEFERPDQFSNRYYEDPFKSWILYLSNKITDPYYEWYLQPDELNALCEKKYGSVYNAQTKVKYFQNDYLKNETISISYFNSLTQEMQKYWEAEYGVNDTMVGYKRKRTDWITTTNKIIKYNITGSNNFIKDEMVEIRINEYVNGKGQILSVQGNSVFLQHVFGTYYSDIGDYGYVYIAADEFKDYGSVTSSPLEYVDGLYLSSELNVLFGRESETKAYITGFTEIANNIPLSESLYWRPVTYYDYENEKNEFNKSILVLDSQYSRTISRNLKELLKV